MEFLDCPLYEECKEEECIFYHEEECIYDMLPEHEAIFCTQNPETELECMGCHENTRVNTALFLVGKDGYELTCSHCQKTTHYNTEDFHKKIEFLKNFLK